MIASFSSTTCIIPLSLSFSHYIIIFSIYALISIHILVPILTVKNPNYQCNMCIEQLTLVQYFLIATFSSTASFSSTACIIPFKPYTFSHYLIIFSMHAQFLKRLLFIVCSVHCAAVWLGITRDFVNREVTI